MCFLCAARLFRPPLCFGLGHLKLGSIEELTQGPPVSRAGYFSLYCKIHQECFIIALQYQNTIDKETRKNLTYGIIPYLVRWCNDSAEALCARSLTIRKRNQYKTDKGYNYLIICALVKFILRYEFELLQRNPHLQL